MRARALHVFCSSYWKLIVSKAISSTISLIRSAFGVILNGVVVGFIDRSLDSMVSLRR